MEKSWEIAPWKYLIAYIIFKTILETLWKLKTEERNPGFEECFKNTIKQTEKKMLEVSSKLGSESPWEAELLRQGLGGTWHGRVGWICFNSKRGNQDDRVYFYKERYCWIIKNLKINWIFTQYYGENRYEW